MAASDTKRRPSISAASLDRLFAEILRNVHLPDDVNREEVELALQQKIERNDRRELAKLKKARDRDAAQRAEEERRAALKRLQDEKASDAFPELADIEEKQGKAPDSSAHTVRDDRQSADQAFSEIRQFLAGARAVTLIDPYLFQFRQTAYFKDEAEYIDKSCWLMPRTAERLAFVAPDFKTSVKSGILNRLKDGRYIRWISTDRIHDRFFLRGDNRGLYTGTSSGGFGSKYFLMNEMGTNDVLELKAFLYEIDPSRMSA
ncbi:hypothetical protein I6F07_32395 [Ensifer sp. IC4062]|nr:hypothetical protein [Ensifer sp. IC4062]MCA1444782.1 hypothetical protein [Ensifer sp. IC4062]